MENKYLRKPNVFAHTHMHTPTCMFIDTIIVL